jgi:hypothetical protein
MRFLTGTHATFQKDNTIIYFAYRSILSLQFIIEKYSYTLLLLLVTMIRSIPIIYKEGNYTAEMLVVDLEAYTSVMYLQYIRYMI